MTANEPGRAGERSPQQRVSDAMKYGICEVCSEPLELLTLVREDSQRRDIHQTVWCPECRSEPTS